MVDHKSSGGFKFGYGQNETDNTEFARREEFAEQKVEKLGHRITLIAILFPVLIGVIFTVAYLDIKKRVFSMHDVGVEELKKLSRDLESRFSSLSVRFAGLEDDFSEREKSLKNLEESFSKKIVPMEEIFLSMETTMQSLKKADQTLSETEKALEQKVAETQKNFEKAMAEKTADLQALKESAADTKEISSQFAVIDESFAVLRDDIQTLSTRMQDLDKNYKTEFETLAEYLQKEKTRLDQSIQATEALSEVVAEFRKDFNEFAESNEQFVRDSELPLEMEKARLKLKVALDEAVIKMERRVDSLEKKIDSATGAKPVPKPSKPGEIIERSLE